MLCVGSHASERASCRRAFEVGAGEAQDGERRSAAFVCAACGSVAEQLGCGHRKLQLLRLQVGRRPRRRRRRLVSSNCAHRGTRSRAHIFASRNHGDDTLFAGYSRRRIASRFRCVRERR